MKRKQSIWIVGILVVVAGIAYPLLRPVKDEYQPLSRYIVKDETTYYSGADLTGAPLHDASIRFIEIEAVPAAKFFEVVEAVASSHELRRHKTKKFNNPIVYTLTGKVDAELGAEPCITVSVKTNQSPDPARPLHLSVKPNDLISARIYDSRLLSAWDEIRVRARNRGRFPSQAETMDE